MGWPLYWFIVFVIELCLIGCVIYLHYAIKIDNEKRNPIRFKITRTIEEVPKEKTKREIMNG